MRKSSGVVGNVVRLFPSCAVLLASGGALGSTIDAHHGTFYDPIGDGFLKGVIAAAVVYVGIVVLAIRLDPVRISKKNKHRVAARNSSDAAKRREEERRDRQYWKRVYWNRTH